MTSQLTNHPEFINFDRVILYLNNLGVYSKWQESKHQLFAIPLQIDFQDI
jgi:hypothetical protein